MTLRIEERGCSSGHGMDVPFHPIQRLTTLLPFGPVAHDVHVAAVELHVVVEARFQSQVQESVVGLRSLEGKEHLQHGSFSVFRKAHSRLFSKNLREVGTGEPTLFGEGRCVHGFRLQNGHGLSHRCVQAFCRSARGPDLCTVVDDPKEGFKGTLLKFRCIGQFHHELQGIHQ